MLLLSDFFEVCSFGFTDAAVTTTASTDAKHSAVSVQLTFSC